mmetsp:Transcript_12413/g.34176  ORF Transcript_12413/g.34176 Transcript_12413/m.34176 type:complete len:270 (+) Transcript_12413:1371-2180(+)
MKGLSISLLPCDQNLEPYLHLHGLPRKSMPLLPQILHIKSFSAKVTPGLSASGCPSITLTLWLLPKEIFSRLLDLLSAPGNPSTLPAGSVVNKFSLIPQLQRAPLGSIPVFPQIRHTSASVPAPGMTDLPDVVKDKSWRSLPATHKLPQLRLPSVPLIWLLTLLVSLSDPTKLLREGSLSKVGGGNKTFLPASPAPNPGDQNSESVLLRCPKFTAKLVVSLCSTSLSGLEVDLPSALTLISPGTTPSTETLASAGNLHSEDLPSATPIS